MTRDIEPPELPDWAKELAKSTQSINDAMQRAIRDNQQAMHEAAEAAARYATIVKPDFQRTIDQIRRLWLRSAPDNWHGLGDEALALTDLVQESGICLVWVPRETVIRRLLGVEATARPAELALLSEERCSTILTLRWRRRRRWSLTYTVTLKLARSQAKQ